MQTVFPEARANFIVPQSRLHRLAADALWQSRADQVALEVWAKAVAKSGAGGDAYLPDAEQVVALGEGCNIDS